MLSVARNIPRRVRATDRPIRQLKESFEINVSQFLLTMVCCRAMYRLRTRAVCLLLVSLLLLSSCSLDAVGKFANQSSQALAQGPALLKDIAASCIRRELIKAKVPYYGLDQPDKAAKTYADAAKNCEEFTNDLPAMLVASKTLTDYFTAISQLATTGKTSKGKNTQSDKQDAQNAAKTPKSITLIQSVGKIIDLIGKVAAEGYRTEHLQKDLNSVSSDVDAVLGALGNFGSVDYNSVLTVEQQEYERQFNNLGTLPANDSTTIIGVLAKDDESNEARLIAAKHAAATAYGDAIKQIIAGHKALLQHQGKLDAKDVPSLIQPYTDSLSQIVQKLTPLF